MDLTFSEESRELAGLVRDLCAKYIDDEVLTSLDDAFGPGTEAAGVDRATARVVWPLWEALVEAGVPAALSPESLGGAGLGAEAAVAVFRELGRVLAPVPLDAVVLGSRLLAAAGLDELGGQVAGGSLIACADEGIAGQAVDWAPVADVVVRAPGEGSGSGSGSDFGSDSSSGDVVVLDLRSGGTVERLVPVDFGCTGLVTGGDELARGPVDEAVVAYVRQLRRVLLSAYQWGVLEAALERTAAYASEREQFGRPIGTFQAVASRLADGSIDVDAVRLATLRAAYELDNCSEGDSGAAGGAAPSAAALSAVASAHFWACEAGHRIAHTAVHIHGGVGLDRDAPTHRYFLAAKAGEFRLGGATAQLQDLGRVLVAHGDPFA